MGAEVEICPKGSGAGGIPDPITPGQSPEQGDPEFLLPRPEPSSGQFRGTLPQHRTEIWEQTEGGHSNVPQVQVAPSAGPPAAPEITPRSGDRHRRLWVSVEKIP